MTMVVRHSVPSREWTRPLGELGTLSGTAVPQGAGKAPDTRGLETRSFVFAAQAEKAVGTAAMDADPQLTPPSVAVSLQQPEAAHALLQAIDEEESKLAQLSQNPAYAAMLSTVVSGFTASAEPAGGKGDGGKASRREMPNGDEASVGGSGFFGDDRVTNLLLLVTETLQQSQQADLKLQSTMVQVSRHAAESQADSLVRQGRDIFGSSLSGAVLQTSLSGAGAAQKFKGLARQRSSIEHNLQPAADLRRMRNRGERAVFGASHGADGLQANGAETVGVRIERPGGAIEEKQLAASAKKLPEQHANALLETSPEHLHAEENLRLQHDKNQTHWQRLHIHGSLLETAGQITNRQAESAGAMMQKTEQSQQTLAQNSETVSRSATSLHQENAQKFRELMQKVHEAVNRIVSNNGAVASQVASSLRV